MMRDAVFEFDHAGSFRLGFADADCGALGRAAAPKPPGAPPSRSLSPIAGRAQAPPADSLLTRFESMWGAGRRR
jgi:hypothetical protein